MNKGLYGISKNRTYEPPLSASYATTAVTSSYPISVTGYRLISTATGVDSIFFGENAGYQANSAFNSNFLGYQAGAVANNASFSNFLGIQAGFGASNAYFSNFLGNNTGYLAINANYSNFFGLNAGGNASSASYSTLIGYNAGLANPSSLSIGTNNIIIGTNITLEAQRRDSINIGGIIFGTGSYFETGSFPFSGSANGRIGINVVNPTYSFEVSGTVGFPNLTNSSTATKVVLVDNSGQLFTTASSALGGGSVTPGDGNQAIQFNSASVFNGSAKLKYDYVNSNVILTGSLLLSQSYISKVDYVDFTPNLYDTVTPGTVPTHTEGKIFYDTGSQSVNVYNSNPNITLNVGQQTWIRVRNQTGVTITKGSAVKLNGAVGNRPSINLAQSTDQVQTFSTTIDIIGIANDDIAQGTDGFVTTYGEVYKVNTAGFSAGDLLWVSQSAGQYTNVAPSAPFDKTFVGVVTRVNANNGSIFVFPQQPIHFHDISSVSQSGAYTQGDMWMFKQSGSSGVWTNTKTLSGSYTLSGSLNTNGSVSVQSLTASVVSASSITGSLFGTASWSINAVTASFAPSYVLTSATSSMLQPYVLTSQTSSMLQPYVLTSQTSSMLQPYVLTSQTSSMLQPYVLTSQTSSMLQPYVLTSQTSSMTVATASYILASNIAGNLSRIASGSVTASVTPSQFSVVSGSTTEFTVTGTGVTIGNAITDTHSVTGSLGITGSLTVTGPITLLPVTNSFAISASGYYITGSNATPMIDLSGSWITSGTPTLIRANITNISSSAASTILDLQQNGSSVFNVVSSTSRVNIQRSGGSPGIRISNTAVSNQFMDLLVSGNSAVINLGSGITGAPNFYIGNQGGFAAMGMTNGTDRNVRCVFGNNGQDPSGFYSTLLSSANFDPGAGGSIFGGTTQYVSFHANPTINQTTGTSITRGLFINPTLTSAADFRAIEVNSGSLVMADSYLASGSRSGSLVNLTHLTNTAGNITSFVLNSSGSAGASSNIMDLQVAGTSSFTVSRTGAVTINTFASTAAFSYTNGGITYLTYQPSNNTLAVGSTSARGTITAAVLTLSNSNTSTTAGVISIDNPKSTSTGSVDYVTNTSTISPTAGTSSFNGYTFAATINQTSTAAGITRGLFINPTLTSATDFRAIETTAGRIIFSSAQFTGSVSQSSYFTITGSMRQPATTGSQIYAATVAPLITYTAPGQTNTAFRVLSTFTGSTALTASQQNIIADFGASAVGSQFVVNDVTSGSIYQVNDVSGLPIIEATSNWDVNIYDFPNVVFRKTGNNIIISGSLNVTGSVNVATGSLTLTSGSVTMPNRPAFRVIGTSSTDRTATTTLSGSAVSVDYNQGGFYNNTTGVFTAPIAGLYSVYMNIRCGSVNAQQQAILYRNSTTSSLMWEAAGNTGATHFGVSGILNLAANDNLRVVVAVGSIQFDANDNWGAAYIG